MSAVPGTPLQKKVLSRGPKILMLGREGSGKTDSIRTLIESGLKVFCIFLEPGFEVLQDTSRGRKVYTCVDGLHWKYIPIASPSFKEMADAAEMLNKFSYKALSDLPPMNTAKYRSYYELMATMAALKCDRCGVNFGPADHLPYDEWAVVNDSLTSISKAALLLHIGSKPGVHQGEYGICMRNIETYIDKFTNDMPCMGVMLAHIDREPDPVSGSINNMVSTLGQKLAPKVPRPFSDVILAVREVDKFRWSTVENDYNLKTRNFPFKKDLPPSFAPVVQSWKSRIKAEEAASAASEQIAAAKAAAAPKP